VLTPHGKRLARGAAGHEVDLTLVFLEIYGSNVGTENVPILHGLYLETLILPDGVATVKVALDHINGFETRLMEANSKPSSSRE
jgi:hypothetical protein